MATTSRKIRNYRMAATLFSSAGLVCVLSAFIGGNFGLNIYIGIVNVCIGMMFVSRGKRAEKDQIDESKIVKEPNKPDAGDA